MISVVIPLYNKEPIIEKSLCSVLSQDYDDFEVVVVNDGSTDKSAEIIKGINDPRISLIEQENSGPAKARNTGLKNASGEWIIFLDADDELMPGALSHFVTVSSMHQNVNIICCNYYIQSGNNKKLAYNYKEKIIDNNFRSHYYGEFLARTGATMYRRELVHKYLFDERLRRFEDLEQLFRMYVEATICLSNTPVLLFNTDYTSASRGRKDIKEDFLGYLEFKGKSFWEKMCLYQFYLGERPLYPNQVETLYPTLKYRYDLLFLTKLLKTGNS